MINWEKKKIQYTHTHDSQLLLIVDTNNSSPAIVIAKAICLPADEISLQCFDDIKGCMLLSYITSTDPAGFDTLTECWGLWWLTENTQFMMHVCMQVSLFDMSRPYALNRCICLVVRLCARYWCASWLRGFSTVWVQLLSFPALLFL